MTKAILEFRDDYHFLSNFFLCSFTWNGILWPHSEAAYQAAKSQQRNVQLQFVNLTPGQAKRHGRNIVMRSDWDEVRVEIMAEILYAKFQQNPHLKQMLVDTGDAILVEGNWWGDKFWGVSPAGSNNGQNHLGRLLMELRTLFQIELEHGTLTPVELEELRQSREQSLSNIAAGNGLVSF